MPGHKLPFYVALPWLCLFLVTRLLGWGLTRLEYLVLVHVDILLPYLEGRNLVNFVPAENKFVVW